MATFTGIFFDGKTEGPLAAQVTFIPAALQISFRVPGQAVPVTIYWQVHRLVKETTAGSGKIILRYGTYPGQSLEITHSGFWPAFEEYYAPSPVTAPQNQKKDKAAKKGLGVIYLFFIFLLALVPVVYFFILPAAADMAARQIPEVYEQKLGKLLADKLIPADHIDSVKTAGLSDFIRQLKLTKTTGLQVLILRHPVPNAFALPGGTIVVHQGMLPLLQTPDELAALLGHEYGHIQLRHSWRTLFRSLSGYFLISVIFGDVSALSAVILQNAHAFKSLAYSRTFEKEADEMGLKILLKNHLDPFGMVRLFKNLQRQNPNQNQENEYLSSHPLLSSRIAYIREAIKQHPHQIIKNDSVSFYFQKLKEK